MTGIVAAAGSHVGAIRANNQDSGYRGRNLFVVADGMGGHAGGDIASSVAVNRILQVDQEFDSIAEARIALESALSASNTLLADTVVDHPELAGMGTTVSALLRVGDEVALAHIGDSRIYLYRDRELTQITTDHTFVQRLVDTGRITPEEALVHPRRSVLMRVLGDIDAAPEIDTEIYALKPGDRWLICSDGLSSYVESSDLATVLREISDPERAVEELIERALAVGAPDNVTAVLVDVTTAARDAAPPQLVGSAVDPLTFEIARKASFRLVGTLRHPIKAVINEDSHFEPGGDQYLDALIAEDQRRARWRRLRWLTAIVLLLAAIAIAGVLGYQWTQSRYYVGVEDGYVAIYQGVQQDLGPISLSHLYEMTEVPVEELSPLTQQRLEETVSAGSLTEARSIVDRITGGRDG